MIFPRPKSEKYTDGICQVDFDNGLGFQEFYNRYIDDNQLKLSVDPSFSCEEYNLIVDDGGIHIVHKTSEGPYRAFATFSNTISFRSILRTGEIYFVCEIAFGCGIRLSAEALFFTLRLAHKSYL